MAWYRNLLNRFKRAFDAFQGRTPTVPRDVIRTALFLGPGEVLAFRNKNGDVEYFSRTPLTTLEGKKVIYYREMSASSRS